MTPDPVANRKRIVKRIGKCKKKIGGRKTEGAEKRGFSSNQMLQTEAVDAKANLVVAQRNSVRLKSTCNVKQRSKHEAERKKKKLATKARHGEARLQ